MLKVRLMGTKNDIKWFGKILQRNPKIEQRDKEILPDLCGSQEKQRKRKPVESKGE